MMMVADVNIFLTLLYTNFSLLNKIALGTLVFSRLETMTQMSIPKRLLETRFLTFY